jgi:SPP1 gp7 family putative phage head morphogenesis protein
MRLENLKAEIAKEYRSLTGKSVTMCGDTSQQSYIGAFEQSWFNMEKSIGSSLTFGIPPVDAIRASVYSEYSGASFPYRFGKLYTSTTDKISEAITRGLATGHGYRKTASEIKQYFDGSYNNALRVIRTESTRNFTEGNNYAYQQAKDQGIEGVETWLATFDGRTRDSHARLNGQEAKDGYFKIDGDKAIGPGLFSSPENSINCRCSTYFKLSGFDYSPDWKYKTWKNEFGEWKKQSPVINKKV